MTTMITHRSLAALLYVALLSSCKIFDETAVQTIADPDPLPGSRIKFHNFAPSSVGVNFFANDVKMTAVSATTCTPLPTVDSLRTKCLQAGIESATGTAYPGLAAGERYLTITPGQYTLSSRRASFDTVVSTLSQAIEANKYYSFFMSGIYSATGNPRADAFILEDAIPTGAPDFTVAHVRLVNAISNGTGDLNLFLTQVATPTPPEVAIGGATAYKAASGFIAVPAGTYNLRIAYTGAGTNLITRTGISLVGGRVYTITARGSTATASTLGADFSQNWR
jgi:hypothetical protein